MEPHAGSTVKTKGDLMTATLLLCNRISSELLSEPVIFNFLVKMISSSYSARNPRTPNVPRCDLSAGI